MFGLYGILDVGESFCECFSFFSLDIYFLFCNVSVARFRIVGGNGNVAFGMGEKSGDGISSFNICPRCCRVVFV